jgi:2-isopropylmalate synthase
LKARSGSAEGGRIVLYDSTLREGDQSAHINFSKEDKLLILEKLDAFGMDYVEGGWPGANPKDTEFFREAGRMNLTHARLAAFGMTRRPDGSASRDPGIHAMLRSGARVATLVGKTWDLHVREALRVSYGENLRMIHDSVSYLKRRLETVFFDAEHFFDGYLSNPEYCLRCLRAAEEAGADCLVLCDTSGGMIPEDVQRIVREVLALFRVPLGIHAHNDSELAVANTLAAVREGVVQVQGTVNGYGERCGNANLCSVIPNLQLKMRLPCVPAEKLRGLRECSRFVAELANQIPDRQRPYVGESAFAHKGGIHVSAVIKNPRTYEHIQPEAVGNQRRFLVSDVSGKATIEEKARQFRLDLGRRRGAAQEIMDALKSMERKGYRYEGAEASFELMMRKAVEKRPTFFRLLGFRVIDEKREEKKPPYSEATVMIEVDGRVEHTAAEGAGPVNALDHALRKALEKFYPQLRSVRLLDYKVRVLPSGEGTASHVRVLIESGDGTRKWSTVGVSHNIIEASWQALADSVDYKLQMDPKGKGTTRARRRKRPSAAPGAGTG